MDLKDKFELELLRVITTRIIAAVDAQGYDWRDDLRAGAASDPIRFKTHAQPGQNIEEALEAAFKDVAIRLGFEPQDHLTRH
ncbi:hypothetical protein E4191_22595 (plasmid) [Paracoccus liaowanqingii]|uniref:Uncharacterized protein n=1 Tax=Paracoccus liaowanqingii TaxID=2560053 RepID=A0A4Y5SU22_9RHOB|nr:hypothetical protein [Paracoccus liaowanqingii]QDA36859.1 hypothetical protein E4191_22595 [Paracoccus liaowanqingii]